MPRVPIAPARPAADRHFRRGPPFSSPLSCRLPAQRSRPYRPYSIASAPRPGRGRRWAGGECGTRPRACCTALSPPRLQSSVVSPFPPLPAVVFRLFAWRCRRPLPARITTVVMSQPGIPASGGALTGLQAQNGEASASGSRYSNG